MKRAAKALIAIVVAFVVYAVWGSHAEGVARKDAAAFCDSVTPGASTDGILDRALAMGVHRMSAWRKTGQGESLMAIFMGMPPFSRHICSVEAAGSLVVSKEVVYLD